MNRVSFSASGIDTVTILLDETPPQITSGYGGWSIVNRQRRKGLTQWDGKDPLRMQIAVLFDGYQDRISQEVPISRLSRMALPSGAGEEPPVVSVDGPGIPNPGPDLWVIESLTWGTQKVLWDFAHNGVMSRLRQDCVVNLLEYVDEDRVAFKNLPAGAGVITGPSASGWPKQYITVAGDTLRTIAASFYKDATKWKKIATANGLRDAKAVTAGMILRIPAP